MSFFGWTAEQRGGVWYARKFVDGGNYGSTGAVWVRKAITGLGRDATKRDAERGIMRMYRAGVLN